MGYRREIAFLAPWQFPSCIPWLAYGMRSERVVFCVLRALYADFPLRATGSLLAFHRLHEIGRRRSFERQSIADFTHNALLQRLNKVDARVAARHFLSFLVQLGDFARPALRLTARHNFGNHSPFVSSTRRERLWI